MFFIVLQVLNILLLHFHFSITVCLLLAPGSNQLCFLEGKKGFSFLNVCLMKKESPKTHTSSGLKKNFTGTLGR